MILLRTIIPMLLVVILQLRFLPLLQIGGVVPDPGLIWLLARAPGKKDSDLVLTAFVLGLTLDLPAGAMAGLHSLAYLPAVWYFRRYVPPRKSSGFVWGSLHLLIPVLMFHLLYHGLLLSGEHAGFLGIILHVILPSALYSWVILTTWRGFRS